jgi:hypothetical protein
MMREVTGCDALWSYDPGIGSSTGARFARHAQGPAPSMQSCVALTDVSGIAGALFDSSGYMTTVFSVSGYSCTDTIAAWNGSGVVWIGNVSSSVVWKAFDLSGTLLTTKTLGSSSMRKACVACDSNGYLVLYVQSGLTGSIQRIDASGTLVNSLSVTNTPTALCVDSSDNVIVNLGSVVVKYDTSFSQQWSVALGAGGGATIRNLVAGPSGGIYAAYEVSTTGDVQLSLIDSSGAISWTVTIGSTAVGAFQFRDLWSDGTYAYLAFLDGSAESTREKYNSSGTQVFSERICFEDGDLSVVNTIRADGSLMALAGTRGE